MASTPSASALSAVLRCRGNIWTRKQPSKRPATSVYSLGIAGGTVRGSPAERTRSQHESTWGDFLQGQRVLVGRRVTLAFKSAVDVKAPREKDSRKFIKLCHPKLAQSSGDAHSAVPADPNAMVRQLAGRLISHLSGRDKFSTIIRAIKYNTYASHVCKIVFVQGINQSPALKVPITSPYWMNNAGQMPDFVISCWSTMRSACLSLTALVSGFLFLKLAVLCRSTSSPDSSTRLLSQLGEKSIRADALQVSIMELFWYSQWKDTCCYLLYELLCKLLLYLLFQRNGNILNPNDLTPIKDTLRSGQGTTEDGPDWVQGFSNKKTQDCWKIGLLTFTKISGGKQSKFGIHPNQQLVKRTLSLGY